MSSSRSTTSVPASRIWHCSSGCPSPASSSPPTSSPRSATSPVGPDPGVGPASGVGPHPAGDEADRRASTLSREAAALVRGLIELGRALGLTVVAQGVESEAQVAALRALGCSYAQGPFLVGREAVPPGDAVDGSPAADPRRRSDSHPIRESHRARRRGRPDAAADDAVAEWPATPVREPSSDRVAVGAGDPDHLNDDEPKRPCNHWLGQSEGPCSTSTSCTSALRSAPWGRRCTWRTRCGGATSPTV